MFEKILVANRGEIACRIMRTARRLGIHCVAVYSDADADALHVHQADEAVHLGASPASESYASTERLVTAARKCGADAVHPGYGFLAENAVFAKAVEDAGITFIGPGHEAIAALGDKISARAIAESAGVNVLQGAGEAITSVDNARKAAQDIGFPVMIKAAAGGGGRGMRVAHDVRDIGDAYASAVSESQSIFADGRVFVEKFIERPRHIEIQILADSMGKVVHIGERDCSIQRRHQKVIEEAPCTSLDGETRAAMCAQAIALAQAVNYRSAGTVEFIVDPAGRFYFLEMNTRLQVEHPVTEMISGIDLVEQMIRVAAGEPLAFEQADLRFRGAAIEARICAEDPSRDFLPSTGRVSRLSPPPETESVRVEAGLAEGCEVGIHYDSLIAKLCVHGETRAAAVAMMSQVLDQFVIGGLSHNIAFLASLVRHADFAAGNVSTDFIREIYPDGFQAQPADGAVSNALLAVAVLAHLRRQARAVQISGRMPGHRDPTGADWVVVLAGQSQTVTAVEMSGGYDLETRDGKIEIRGTWPIGGPLFEGTVDDRDVAAQIVRRSDGYQLLHGGACVIVKVQSARAAELASRMPAPRPPDNAHKLLSPMSGLVVSIKVSAGDEVRAGQPLAIVDAMKMENVLRAEFDAKVAKVCAAEGDSIALDQVVLEFHRGPEP